MEIETPLSPTSIPATQAVAMEIDASGASSPPKPINNSGETAPRPTLADVLKGHEEIRKDKARKKAMFKAEMPKPLAADLHAIEQLFANRRPSWEVLSSHLTAAQTFAIPTAKISLVLETGQAFARIPPTQLLESFVRDHGNPVLEELFSRRAIGQLAKYQGVICGFS
uniref:AlNc14C81G5291 protein n=1 Tax=Albugo laibachii Nc14 TaxID=890382 RepID=F0WF99_9STRA|nr:AlNc14C81G5291 [Albugo laibachii Nc14]|eukprot:CCA19881.1 AlNc14C81G5291 [Albugo laibachii Nc14]